MEPHLNLNLLSTVVAELTCPRRSIYLMKTYFIELKTVDGFDLYVLVSTVCMSLKGPNKE